MLLLRLCCCLLHREQQHQQIVVMWLVIGVAVAAIWTVGAASQTKRVGPVYWDFRYLMVAKRKREGNKRRRNSQDPRVSRTSSGSSSFLSDFVLCGCCILLLPVIASRLLRAQPRTVQYLCPSFHHMHLYTLWRKRIPQHGYNYLMKSNRFWKIIDWRIIIMKLMNNVPSMHA